MSALGWTRAGKLKKLVDGPDRNSREVFPTFSFLKLLPVLVGSLVFLSHVLRYPNNAEPLCKLALCGCNLNLASVNQPQC